MVSRTQEITRNLAASVEENRDQGRRAASASLGGRREEKARQGSE